MLLPIISVRKNYSGFQIQNGESKRRALRQKSKESEEKEWEEKNMI